MDMQEFTKAIQQVLLKQPESPAAYQNKRPSKKQLQQKWRLDRRSKTTKITKIGD